METALISGIFLVVVTLIEVFAAKDRKSAKREREKAQVRAERRERESMLAMNLQSATCALALVTAKKLNGHHTNGDVEEAMEKATSAQEDYNDFIQQMAAHEVNKI